METALLKKPQAMIFDMDGTLFQTETLILPAYHRLFDQLREEGLYQGETPPEERMLNSLGLLLEQIWQNVMPEADLAVHRRADELLLELEIQGLQEGKTRLYSGVGETLSELNRRGVRLFVASNGLEHYVKGVAQAHGILPLFESLYSAGEYQTRTKVDLVRLLLGTHGIRTAWMVGDRSSDVEAGKQNDLTVIGCNYAGFGKGSELSGSDVVITKFDQLLRLYEDAK